MMSMLIPNACMYIYIYIIYAIYNYSYIFLLLLLLLLLLFLLSLVLISISMIIVLIINIIAIYIYIYHGDYIINHVHYQYFYLVSLAKQIYYSEEISHQLFGGHFTSSRTQV